MILRIEPYRPSNGTEGEGFIGKWCENCTRDIQAQRHENYEKGCPILAASFRFHIGEEGYPKEWQWIENSPVCTAFKPLSTLSDAARKAWATRRRRRNESHASDLFAGNATTKEDEK